MALNVNLFIEIRDYRRSSTSDLIDNFQALIGSFWRNPRIILSIYRRNNHLHLSHRDTKSIRRA